VQHVKGSEGLNLVIGCNDHVRVGDFETGQKSFTSSARGLEIRAPRTALADRRPEGGAVVARAVT
jgi:hypothetical protein